MAPIFFDYKRTSLGLKKMTMALDVFNTYLQREHTEYVAGSKYHDFNTNTFYKPYRYCNSCRNFTRLLSYTKT